MPTHQGTSQTDIPIGSGGSAARVTLTITAVTTGTCDVQVDGDTWSIVARDAAGGEAAAVWGACSVDVDGPYPLSTSAAWTPAAAGTTPLEGPLDIARAWSTGFVQRRATVATVMASFDAGSAEGAGVTRTVDVVAQDDEELSLHLGFADATGAVLDVWLTLTTTATGDRSTTIDGPTVADDLP